MLAIVKAFVYTHCSIIILSLHVYVDDVSDVLRAGGHGKPLHPNKNLYFF